jgi:NADH-quinone oxidoreductase subunit C
VTDTSDLEQNPLIVKLRTWDPGAVLSVANFRDELTVIVNPAELRRAAEFLRADDETRFDFLSDIAAVDRFPLEPRFELNYQLLSISLRHTLRLRVTVPGGADAQIDSVTSVWPAADWMEREIFDLFGVRFNGHPDLRRILMPENWEGHPLRKDYPVEGYR